MKLRAYMSELISQNNSTQFAYGSCENTNIIGESISLCQTAGRYIPAGCYTTQTYNCAPFSALAASACCDAPCKTAFELLVRIMVNGNWSRWLSFGKFSAFIKRRSSAASCDEAVLENGILTVNQKSGADAFQLKVYLYSDNPSCTPVLNMLSASVKPMYAQNQTSELTVRQLPVPAYSQMVRSPLLRGKIALPTAVSMLLNRHGEDILPEQAAHAMLDYETNEYTNISFAAALCGVFGYDSASVFCDIAYLKKEIRYGYAAAAAVTEGGAIVVRGFDTDENGNELVIVNDPDAENNDDSEKRLPIEEFSKIFKGLCLLLHDKRKGAGTSAPVCRPAGIKKENGEYILQVAGLPVVLPPDFTQNGDNIEGTVCACAKNTMAFASAAQKDFEYLTISQSGGIIIDPEYFSKGTRVTVYVVDSTGNAYAAEISI